MLRKNEQNTNISIKLKIRSRRLNSHIETTKPRYSICDIILTQSTVLFISTYMR